MRASVKFGTGLLTLALLSACGSSGTKTLNTDVNFANRSSSSAQATSSGVMLGSSSSRSIAPFSMGSLSSSSMAMVMVPSGSGAGATAPDQYVKVHVDTDKGDAKQGDQVFFTVTVKNLSTVPVGNFKVVFTFSPAQLSVIETDGTAQLDNVQWTMDPLLPGNKRALRVRAQVISTVMNGDHIGVHAIATVNNFVQASAGSAMLTVGTPVLPQQVVPQPLPHTGPGDFSGPLENTARFLFPFHSGSAGIPAAVWLSVIAVGMAFGMRMGRRFF